LNIEAVTFSVLTFMRSHNMKTQNAFQCHKSTDDMGIVSHSFGPLFNTYCIMTVITPTKFKTRGLKWKSVSFSSWREFNGEHV